MTIQIYWQLDPAAERSRSEPGDRPRWQPVIRDIRTASLNRYDHYAQIARAAAITGFDGLFIRHRDAQDDSQIIAAAIARSTPRLLLVARIPGVGRFGRLCRQAGGELPTADAWPAGLGDRARRQCQSARGSPIMSPTMTWSPAPRNS